MFSFFTKNKNDPNAIKLNNKKEIDKKVKLRQQLLSQQAIKKEEFVRYYANNVAAAKQLNVKMKRVEQQQRNILATSASNRNSAEIKNVAALARGLTEQERRARVTEKVLMGELATYDEVINELNDSIADMQFKENDLLQTSLRNFLELKDAKKFYKLKCVTDVYHDNTVIYFSLSSECIYSAEQFKAEQSDIVDFFADEGMTDNEAIVVNEVKNNCNQSMQFEDRLIPNDSRVRRCLLLDVAQTKLLADYLVGLNLEEKLEAKAVKGKAKMR